MHKYCGRIGTNAVVKLDKYCGINWHKYCVKIAQIEDVFVKT